MEKEYTLHKYLNGAATAEEIEQLQADPEYASFLKIAETTTSFDTPSFDEKASFKAISEKINQKPKVKKLNPWATVLKIAAVFAVIVGGYLYFNSLGTTVSTSVAEKEHFNLPDGSEVALNANSTIEYHKKKWNDNRTLNLNGEAYFKVSKGNTFTVHTKNGDITVLGTQFNVFTRDSNLKVVCYEGLVSVAYNDTLVRLPAGTSLQIKEGTVITEDRTTAASPSWLANESNFENAILATVLDELKRQYDIEVDAPKAILNKRFSGSFTHNDLDLALELISAPLNLTYTIEKDHVTLYAAQNK
ncbi:FecR family protein [Marixanthomonas spongiae]|uniref:Histidine kinase n=1 Tax=Marixanthomonas spongiae TaxID=2174845 RepID=A0A2U0HX26_9FLAO|nr:FecR domain-containing protein [Marixanthomonas spongiae]PVW13397.1 histidine kinase [Marixanthomonas spongiae]